MIATLVLLVGGWTSVGLGYDGPGMMVRADLARPLTETLGVVVQARGILGSKACCGDVSSYAMLTGLTFGARGWYGELGVNAWRAEFDGGITKDGEGLFAGVLNRSQRAVVGVRWFAPSGVDQQEILRAYVDVAVWRDLVVSVESEWHSFEQEGQAGASGRRSSALVGWRF